jgi:hypothetical protein
LTIGRQRVGRGVDRQRRQRHRLGVALAGQGGGDQLLALFDASGVRCGGLAYGRDARLHLTDAALHLRDLEFGIGCGNDAGRGCGAIGCLRGTIAGKTERHGAECRHRGLLAAAQANPADRVAVVNRQVPRGEERLDTKGCAVG